MTKKFAIFLLAFAPLALAQSGPQINLSGSIGVPGSAPMLASASVVMADANYSLTTAQAASYSLNVSSSVALTATRAITAPLNYGQSYLVTNATTGGQSITFGGVSGTTVTIANGLTALVNSPAGTGYVAGSAVAGAVLIAPTTSQTVTQPSGTTLGVNRLNGSLYASQFQSPASTGNNGIANAFSSSDCGSGCNVVADPSYAYTERNGYWQPGWQGEPSWLGTPCRSNHDQRQGGNWAFYSSPCLSQWDRTNTAAGDVVHVGSLPGFTGTTGQNYATAKAHSTYFIYDVPGWNFGSALYGPTGWTVPEARSLYAQFNGSGITAGDAVTCNKYAVGDMQCFNGLVNFMGGSPDSAAEGVQESYPSMFQLDFSQLFRGSVSSATAGLVGGTVLTTSCTVNCTSIGVGQPMIDSTAALSSGTATMTSRTNYTDVITLSSPVSADTAEGTLSAGVLTPNTDSGYTLMSVPLTITSGTLTTGGVGCLFTNGYVECAKIQSISGSTARMAFRRAFPSGALFSEGTTVGSYLENTTFTLNNLKYMFRIVAVPTANTIVAVAIIQGQESAQTLPQPGSTFPYNIWAGAEVSDARDLSVIPAQVNGQQVTVDVAAGTSWTGHTIENDEDIATVAGLQVDKFHINNPYHKDAEYYFLHYYSGYGESTAEFWNNQNSPNMHQGHSGSALGIPAPIAAEYGGTGPWGGFHWDSFPEMDAIDYYCGANCAGYSHLFDLGVSLSGASTVGTDIFRVKNGGLLRYTLADGSLQFTGGDFRSSGRIIGNNGNAGGSITYDIGDNAANYGCNTHQSTWFGTATPSPANGVNLGPDYCGSLNVYNNGYYTDLRVGGGYDATIIGNYGIGSTAQTEQAGFLRVFAENFYSFSNRAYLYFEQQQNGNGNPINQGAYLDDSAVLVDTNGFKTSHVEPPYPGLTISSTGGTIPAGPMVVWLQAVWPDGTYTQLSGENLQPATGTTSSANITFTLPSGASSVTIYSDCFNGYNAPITGVTTSPYSMTSCPGGSTTPFNVAATHGYGLLADNTGHFAAGTTVDNGSGARTTLCLADGTNCPAALALGTAGQLPVMNAGATAYAPVTMSGDATISSTGAVTAGPNIAKLNAANVFTGYTETIGGGSRPMTIGFGGEGMAWNRNASTGAIFSNTGYAYQLTHIASTTATSDVFQWQIYTPAGAAVGSPLTFDGTGKVYFGTSQQGFFDTSGVPHIAALVANGSAVTVTVGAGLGTGGTAGCASGYTCLPMRGRLTLVAGDVGSAAGMLATVAFNSTPYSAAPVCHASQNGGASFQGIGSGSETTTSFAVTGGVTPVALGTMTVDYWCEQ